MHVLITGGAGFVGFCLARHLKRCYPAARVTAFDNLKRRGSELNLADFRQRRIEFVHGDVRIADDLAQVSGATDLIIDASAEPSVHAGLCLTPKLMCWMHLNSR